MIKKGVRLLPTNKGEVKNGRTEYKSSKPRKNLNYKTKLDTYLLGIHDTIC